MKFKNKKIKLEITSENKIIFNKVDHSCEQITLKMLSNPH